MSNNVYRELPPNVFQGQGAYKNQVVNNVPSDKPISKENKETAHRNVFGGDEIITFIGSDGVRRDLSVSSLQRAFLENPTEGLRAISEISPILGSAVWTALRLAIPSAHKVRLEVRDRKSKALLPEKEEELKTFLSSMGQEHGGATGLLNSLLQDSFLSKGKGLECVHSSDELGGLTEICAVDPNTMKFARDKTTKKLWPYVSFYTMEDNILVKKWARMPDSRLKWSANDSSSSNPTGRIAFFSAALEALRDLQITTDLGSAVNNAAHPTRVTEIDESAIANDAIKNAGLRQVNKITDYIEKRVAEAREYLRKLKPNENITVTNGSKVSNLDGGDFTGVQPALLYLQSKLVIAAKSLPSLFGIGDGGSNSQEHIIYGKSIQSLLDECVTLLESALTEHFTQKGEDLVVRVHVPLVRTFDELIVANTGQVELGTMVRKVALGFLTLEEACHELYGYIPTGTPIENAVEKVLGVSKTDSNNSNTGRVEKGSGLGK